jgi:CDP-glucose 4,6-dehydratase
MGLVRKGLPDGPFWSGKRVLVTGHTGFKGGWLAIWLNRLGARVSGIALPPDTQPNLYDSGAAASAAETVLCDICDADRIEREIRRIDPEIVFHLAAQSLVLRSYREPLETLKTNIMGTANILLALRKTSAARAAVLVTTDKVYENLERPIPYREDDRLGGRDPYSASKAASEIIIASLQQAFLAGKVAVATARSGNVIGGGDWSGDRLIPDAVKAWTLGKPLAVRNPESIRPWQHVLEPLAGYLVLAETIWQRPELAAAYNFGPNPHEVASVRKLVSLARDSFGRGDTEFMQGNEQPHEAGLLALENSKARHVLGVAPRWNLETAADRTMQWYRGFYRGRPAPALCADDIAAYEAAP